ncbi:MAG: hypothetical protein ACRBCT_10050 [Alphaproteobacteria bacterium]
MLAQQTNYQDLIDELIELKSYTNSGVTQEQWPEMMRGLSVTISKYKLSNSPSLSESELLDSILSEMRRTLEAWKVDVGAYNCFNKKPSEECIKNYASQLYDVQQVDDRSREDFIASFVENYDAEDSLSDLKSKLVSWRLTFVTFAVKDFFKFHSIDI